MVEWGPQIWLSRFFLHRGRLGPRSVLFEVRQLGGISVAQWRVPRTRLTSLVGCLMQTDIELGGMLQLRTLVDSEGILLRPQ